MLQLASNISSVPLLTFKLLDLAKVNRTREVYKMLQEYNITGTPEVYTIAVRSCSQIGDLEFALKIYDDMKTKGVTPDEVIILFAFLQT